jgi:ABC-type branched-subunit amino acid transport system substrate-binding protein
MVEDPMKSLLVALGVGVVLIAALAFGITVQRHEAAQRGDAAQRVEAPQPVETEPRVEVTQRPVTAPRTDTVQRNEKLEAAQGLATRVGQILGAATACRDVARPRIVKMTDMLMEVFKASTTNEGELGTIRQLYDGSIADGQRAVNSQRIDCGAADRNLADLESAVTAPAVVAPPVAAPPGTAFAGATPAAAAAAPARATAVAAPPAKTAAGVAPLPRTTLATAAPSVPPPPASPLVQGNINISNRGVTGSEIRFGIAAPFSGATKELGHHMKLGIEAAFDGVNASGGVHGRQLRLIAADDGYEPARTADAMKELYEREQVLGVIGNVGTPTAAVALPYALDHKMLFYGAFTGASLLRRDPPDRYVFNYRASYAEETDAVVRYLMKLRKLRPEQIAVFAQQDSYGDAGFEGVAKAMRALRGGDEGTIVRLNYKRNTVDVDEAIAQLRKSRSTIKAIVMVATYRAAAKFIEKTRDQYPAMIYTNVSFVGSTALADELMLLGPKFATGVIVTQVVPAVEGHSSVTLEYKSALATYFPGEAPDYVSLEGYLSTRILVEALNRAGPKPDTEKVVEALESLRDFDIGVGAPLGFSRTEHQGVHKVWGTQLDANGHYQPIELQ